MPIHFIINCDDIILGKTASEIWQKDANRRLFLEAQGWHVIVIWENNKEHLVKK